MLTIIFITLHVGKMRLKKDMTLAKDVINGNNKTRI